MHHWFVFWGNRKVLYLDCEGAFYTDVHICPTHLIIYIMHMKPMYSGGRARRQSKTLQFYLLDIYENERKKTTLDKPFWARIIHLCSGLESYAYVSNGISFLKIATNNHRQSGRNADFKNNRCIASS